MTQFIELSVEEMSNFVGWVGGKATFRFAEPVSNDNYESVTLPEALRVQDEMMELGFSGALIGHPMHASDFHIYFDAE